MNQTDLKLLDEKYKKLRSLNKIITPLSWVGFALFIILAAAVVLSLSAIVPIVLLIITR